MEIFRKETKKEKIEAGDVVEYTSGDDKIIAVVTHINNKDDIIYAITISDNRNYIGDDSPFEQVHFVQFVCDYHLALLMKGSETSDNFEFDKL